MTENAAVNNFGTRLRTARIAAGINQRELGERLGVTGAAVSRWESGRDYPSFSTLPALRDAVYASLDELIVDTIAMAKAAERAAGMMEERTTYRAPDTARAKDSREYALLMRYRLLSDAQQKALLELIKPAQPE